MSKYEKLITAREPEYDKSFWNYARGNVKEAEHLEGGRNFAGAFELPTFHANQCAEAIKELSLFRKIASCAYAAGSENWIAVKDSEEFAVWVPEGGDIPVYDGMYDFTSLKMDYNKLVALVKLDVNLVHDVTFNLQKHLTIRLARNLAKGEDKGFINGTGVDMPVGILCDNGGADVGITTEALTYDDVIGLYFSLKPEYRENGVWLMNDKTALALRTMKDKDGNYLWNQANDTILGKKVYKIALSDKLFQCKRGIVVTARYFRKDETYAPLGSYCTVTGPVQRVDPLERILVLQEPVPGPHDQAVPVRIGFDDLVELTSAAFVEIEEYLGIERYPEELP